MIYGIFVVFHIVACLVLIAVILLQSGRGGGLSEMAGGQGVQQTQKLFGTQTNSLLMKFTSYCAIAFLITSISLVLLTSRRSKSLMEGAQIKPIFNSNQADKPLDKKALEDAIKAIQEASKNEPAEAVKKVETAATATKEAATKTAMSAEDAVKAAALKVQAAATAAAPAATATATAESAPAASPSGDAKK